MAGLYFSEVCTTIAFYGLSFEPSLRRQLYFSILEWCKVNGCEPNKLAVQSPNFSGKIVGFERANKKMVNEQFENVSRYTFFSLTPGGRIDRSEWSSFVSIDVNDCCIVIDKHVATLDKNESFIGLLKQVARCLNPAYGIGLYRDRSGNPEYYCLGMGHGPIPPDPAAKKEWEREAYRSTLWDRIGLKEESYKEGFFRDVYTWNFVTEPQLSRLVDGKRLDDWILSGPNRGSLSAFEGRILLWEIEADKIRAIRGILRENGFFLWHTL